MKVILDERETQLYEKCKSQTNPKIIVEKRVLPLADAIIMTDDDKELVLVERKSLTDLISSIKDGRYAEQSHRLQNCCSNNPHSVMYIIEGSFAQLRNPESEKQVAYSAMVSLNIFKGFSVIRTANVQDTSDWILAMADKMERDFSRGKQKWEPLATSEEPKNYCEVVKKVKKENVTPENIGEIVLCQIPGISAVSAMAIMKAFDSFLHLIETLKTNPACLDNIQCESKGKTRKLSKAVIKNVKDYLIGKEG